MTVRPLLRDLGQRPGLFGTNRNGNPALSIAFFGPAFVLLAIGAAVCSPCTVRG